MQNVMKPSMEGGLPSMIEGILTLGLKRGKTGNIIDKGMIKLLK